MKLLIFTQKVDKNDDVLGFFHAWIKEFSKHCEKITVVCLGKGEYDLPANVKVLSLGKEAGISRLKYLVRFYSYIWKERKNYDSVFVHMNQEYILLGGFLWRIWGKKVALWRNHKKGGILTKIAVMLSNVVFCTSPFSYTARFKKTKLMPVGVDTELFKKNSSTVRIKNSILCIGRISPVKNIDVFIDALLLLERGGYNFHATLVGGALSKDEEYLKMIRNKAEPLLQKNKVVFEGSVQNSKTPEIYARHEVYVNLTDSGSFDKTILEAMASGCLTVASNTSLVDILSEPFLFKERDAGDLAEKLKTILSLSEKERVIHEKSFLEYALRHGIGHLTGELFRYLGK
ncbi:MAG: glycosyltransferase family 4 protein [Parcubacteria group bacterium]|nr:glycosyltransferase family 4 protein [Parcubacteria group bacterium]